MTPGTSTFLKNHNPADPEHATGNTADGGSAVFGSRAAFFVGAFGRWWTWDSSSADDTVAVKDRLASSVMAMESLDVHKSQGELLETLKSRDIAYKLVICRFR